MKYNICKLAILKVLFALYFISILNTSLAQTLVWEDNFTASTINTDNWAYDFGDGCERNLCGWGNSELQYYTSRSENARIVNGNLVIEARKENYLTRAFTSARLKTEGRVHFKYGTLEARIKMPNLANGLWPAFWMLGTSGTWPANGEIDIAELGIADAIASGIVNKKVGAAVHWSFNGSQADYSTSYTTTADFSSDYHIYKMVWDQAFIKVYVDNIEYFNFNISNIAANSLEEFHIPHFIILNLAVGGQYTGILNATGITAPFPGQMLVDYIRLYQNTAGSELYLGKNNAKTGTYGVFTDATPVNDKLTYGNDANLYLWNNLTAITTTPYEGTQVWGFRANAGTWYGMGVANDYKNMSNFYNGYLKFHMKTTSTTTFKIGVSTAHGDSWINFVNGGNQYGLVRNGNWYEVSIPFSAFTNLDLYSVKQMFMLSADAPSTTVDLFIDNVYCSSGAVANNAPTVSITLPANAASFTAPATITINASAADSDGTVAKVDFYNGTTLLGTDVTSPYSFSWTSVAAGSYAIKAVATDNNGAITNSSDVSITVTNAANNLALNKKVVASSTESTALSGTLAVDGNNSTRWASAFSDPQWIYVDLGTVFNINRVKIIWETAYGKNYQIQFSSDAINWTNIKTITANTTLTNDHTSLSGSGRYVRIYGTARATVYGYSIFELEVYGSSITNATVCAGNAANGDYGYQISTTSNIVNWVFIPKAPIAGSTLCILYLKKGTGAYVGYNMTASGSNFIFSENNVIGTNLSFYFTYRVGNTTVERNSSANPHNYTVGTSCSATAIATVNGLQNQILPQQNVNKNLQVFPNPASQQFTIKATDLPTGGTIKIVDIHGRVFYNKPMINNIQIASLPVGIYNVIWTKNNQKMIKQLVIK